MITIFQPAKQVHHNDHNGFTTDTTWLAPGSDPVVAFVPFVVSVVMNLPIPGFAGKGGYEHD
ncbi:MAG: hypothetical protein QME55_15165 [Brevundimonas sp.]|uniref:hypothetical protein n=1 Tax=Brevundimonas sp. TaxID=1871086 RepID=UPI002629A38F|nr:hypothetical protein [Brevundimonas sp.]MDI6626066.1 hypothetical protein [Brevundimonas sp.]MDQ7812081.1 hypothetical protein [Brevundimonas sp.]